MIRTPVILVIQGEAEENRMSDELEICSVEHQNYAAKINLDYKIGRIKLAKHFDIGNDLASVAVSKQYAKQLLLKKPSEFKSGRVPLYVCSLCADLDCGALTVRIEKTENGFAWSEFGYEGLDEEKISQSKYMKRTGPFYFDNEQYKSTITPYI